MPKLVVENSLVLSTGRVKLPLMTTSTMVLGGALILVVLLGVLGVGWWVLRTLEGLPEDLKEAFRSLEPVQAPSNDPAGTLQARVMALEVGFSGLRSEVEEGVKRANQSWARARASESALKRKTELEDGEDESEAGEQLSLQDGGLRTAERVPPVRPVVEGAPEGDVPEYLRLARAQGYPHTAG